MQDVLQALWHAKLDAAADLGRAMKREGSEAVAEAIIAACSTLALEWGGAALLSLSRDHAIERGLPAQVADSAVPRLADWVAAFTCPPRSQGHTGVAVIQALRAYERGLDEAWGTDEQRPMRNPWKARLKIARGHVTLATALIAAAQDELSRTPADAKPSATPLQATRGAERQEMTIERWLASNLDITTVAPETTCTEQAAPIPPSRPAMLRAPYTTPLPARVANAASTARPAPAASDQDHWIEIELVGVDDEPIAFERYQCILPDGSRVQGRLDAAGFARHEGLRAGGTCRLSFPRLDGQAWQALKTLPAKVA